MRPRGLQAGCNVRLLARNPRAWVSLICFSSERGVLSVSKILYRLQHRTFYETMMGRYEPSTWKDLAGWAPAEKSSASDGYLTALKDAAATRAVS